MPLVFDQLDAMRPELPTRTVTFLEIDDPVFLATAAAFALSEDQTEP